MENNIDNILNKFTYHFKRVLINAQNLAFVKKHSDIEPDDLLSALITTKGALASDILIKQNIVIEETRDFQALPTDFKDLPQPSEVSQKIIEKAVMCAYQHQHKYVGTEHLLFSIAESNHMSTNQIFQNSKIDLNNLKQHLNWILKSTSKFGDLADAQADSDIRELETFLEENLSDKPALENFTINLTSQEIQKDIDPVIGRARELDRVIEILSRRTKNNPVLLGDAGVGKTAIVEGLAKRIMENKVPDVLLNKTILTLDLSGLLAGTMYRGEFENRLKQIITEVKNNPNIILFIDELHTIMGAGATGGSLDAANILKPALARGTLRCIGATTFEEFKKHIEGDKALERRFQAVTINESSETETFQILQGIRKNYENFHKVAIDDEALRAAVLLSSRYLPDKKLPDKAIDLIDEAAARYKVRHTKTGLLKKIKELQTKIDNSQANKKQAILNEDYLAALEYKYQEEKYLEEIVKTKALLDKKGQNNLGSIDADHIKEIVAEMTGVPLSSMNAGENRKLLDLDKKLNAAIFGQDKAIKKITDTIRKAKAGLQDKNRPLASFMFLGPSGVGKTETAKQLARHIFGGSHNLLRIDMSEFSQSFNISKLIGSPAGYVGYKEGNKLTDHVKNRPYSLILFDEIEKAHPDVYNLILPILEEGEITDATGRTVNFRNCLIVMTSNIGLSEFNKQASLGFKTEEKNIKNDFAQVSKKVRDSLNKHFPPEFINRLDDVIVFEPLDNKAAKKIINREIDRLTLRLREQKIEITLDPKIVNQLLKMEKAASEGARSLKRLIDAELANPLALAILENKKNKLKVNLVKNKIMIN